MSWLGVWFLTLLWVLAAGLCVALCWACRVRRLLRHKLKQARRVAIAQRQLVSPLIESSKPPSAPMPALLVPVSPDSPGPPQPSDARGALKIPARSVHFSSPGHPPPPASYAAAAPPMTLPPAPSEVVVRNPLSSPTWGAWLLGLVARGGGEASPELAPNAPTAPDSACPPSQESPPGPEKDRLSRMSNASDGFCTADEGYSRADSAASPAAPEAVALDTVPSEGFADCASDATCCSKDSDLEAAARNPSTHGVLGQAALDRIAAWQC